MKIILLLLILFYSTLLFADGFPPAADLLTLDHAFHDVGKVWQVITNMGYLGYHCYTTYAPLKKCEYPSGSGSSYLYGGSILVAGIKNNRKLFSMADAWSENSGNCAYEFYPSAEPWDSVWVGKRGEIMDIPYLPNYSPLADQTLVCRYNDYQTQIMDQVAPMNLEVIQLSHAWGSAPFDEWILFEFYITPTKNDLKDVWIAWWCQASLSGTLGSAGYDNLVYFDDGRNMGVVEDLPGEGDDMIAGPIGYIVFPPDDIDTTALKWTFNNRIMTDHLDEIQYDLMSAGTIDPPSTDGDGGDRGFYRLAFGPIDLAVGDTAHFMVGEVFGEGKENFLENADRLIGLKKNNFQTPFAPPRPDVRVTTSNHAVTLKWDIQPDGVNPETYQDPYRFDSVAQPFEGYRVYKSTQSSGGPWTLLKEFDVPDNEFFDNAGLEYEYTDIGLVNNLDYFYTVTSFSKPDTISFFPSQESSKSGNAKRIAPGTAAPETVGEVAVVPNPYRADISYSAYNPPWESPGKGRQRWVEQDRRVQFINIPNPCEIKIYTLAGDLVQTIFHNDAERGFADWNLTSSVGQTVASGIFLFSVEDNKSGNVQVGKFVIIK